MTRIRIAGPRPELDRTLHVLQDNGALHVDRPRVDAGRTSERLVLGHRRHVERCLFDVETAIARLHLPLDTRASPLSSPFSANEVRCARRVRRRADALARTRSALEDERTALLRYREFFRSFDALGRHELRWPDGQAFYVVLRAGTTGALAHLRQKLDEALAGEVELVHRELSTGECAVLILASARAAPKVSALLSAARVEELPPPAGLAETNLLRALPAIEQRLASIRGSLHAVDQERETVAVTKGEWLSKLRAALQDEMLRLEARSRVFAAEYVFVIEGWLPSVRVPELRRQLRDTIGADVVVATLAERSTGAPTPVALHNPPLFRPFEIFTRILPLPRYGTIDPTPFVAVFVPAFFGLIVGDVGYGLMLAALAWLLRMKSAPGMPLRSVSMVALACSSSTIVFGFLFGEYFGSLGFALGLRPFFDRSEAVLPFLVLAITLGGVHILLALVLAVVTAWRGGSRRKAAGSGVALAMLILTALALLAAVEILPERLLTPFVFAILATFTLLVALEGLIVVVELLSTLAHVLSYARIMALGLASLMLAVVANQMVGAMGSVVVGVVFASLFHLVNFAIALLSPTIQALRLHYVEFFGHFFTPGGSEYRPLAHWRPSA